MIQLVANKFDYRVRFSRKVCMICGRKNKAMIYRLGFSICKVCFRENSRVMGFSKY